MTTAGNNPTPQPPKSRRRLQQEAQQAEAARRRLVERRILEAMAEGKFDNLPGEGRPLHLEDPTPGHEDTWWALRMLKQANVTTDEMRYRKQIDHLKSRLHHATTEADVRRIVREINDCILKLNTLGTNAVPTTLAPLDESRAVEQFHQSRN